MIRKNLAKIKPVKQFKPLTRNDIIALKQADHVIITCIYIHGRPNVARLTCAKQVSLEEFKTWEINVLSSIMFLDDALIEDNLECQFIVHNSCLNWIWQTATGQLFPGDELELLWCPDAETTLPSLKAHWHGDMVKWVVYRDKFRFHYLIGMQLAATNEETRMIRGIKRTLTESILALQ